MWDSRLVILDEPTAALGVAQTEQVLALVNRLAEQGLSVVLISHNLHDIFETATRITVLRLGRNAGIFERAAVSQEDVVHAITAGKPTKVSGIPGTQEPLGMSAIQTEPPVELESLKDRMLDRARSGNMGSWPVIIALVLVVLVFSQTAQNFFTPANFTNIITQMAGTCLLAYGVVFVLLIGEIDLSVSFVSGIGGVVVAQAQLPNGAHLPWYVCVFLAILATTAIGAFQGSIVALVGVPSFVVTLAGFEIWQARDPALGARRDRDPGQRDQQLLQLPLSEGLVGATLVGAGRLVSRGSRLRHLHRHDASGARCPAGATGFPFAPRSCSF